MCNHRSECQCEPGWLPPNCDSKTEAVKSLSTGKFLKNIFFLHNQHAVSTIHFCRSKYCNRTGGYSCSPWCHFWCTGLHVEKTTTSNSANVSNTHSTRVCGVCCVWFGHLQNKSVFLCQSTDPEETGSTAEQLHSSPKQTHRDQSAHTWCTGEVLQHNVTPGYTALHIS